MDVTLSREMPPVRRRVRLSSSAPADEGAIAKVFSFFFSKNKTLLFSHGHALA
jgi:hypothetical protein